MTDQSPLIDVAGTRANLHRVVQGADVAPQRTSRPNLAHPYLDRDTAPPPSTRAATPAPQPAAMSAHTPLPSAAPFEDLDAAPLPVSSDGPSEHASQSTPATDNTPVEPTPPASPDLMTQNGTPLPAATLRRIILHATTAPGVAPAFGRAQANIGGRGLCFGIARFCQTDGTLGRYLTECHTADPEAFAKIFGEDAGALLSVTTAQNEQDRLAPVGGDTLWSPVWIKRFKDAAQHGPFQDMQFKTAADIVVIPLLPLAARFNLRSERALAILTDRAILLGSDATRSLIEGSLAPDTTEAQNIAMLAGIAATSDLAGRTPTLVAENGLSDAPLEFGGASA